MKMKLPMITFAAAVGSANAFPVYPSNHPWHGMTCQQAHRDKVWMTKPFPTVYRDGKPMVFDPTGNDCMCDCQAAFYTPHANAGWYDKPCIAACPTSSPTRQPTSAPTAPTLSPTAAPTLPPTAPTAAPTFGKMLILPGGVIDPSNDCMTACIMEHMPTEFQHHVDHEEERASERRMHEMEHMRERQLPPPPMSVFRRVIERMRRHPESFERMMVRREKLNKHELRCIDNCAASDRALATANSALETANVAIATLTQDHATAKAAFATATTCMAATPGYKPVNFEDT